MSYTAKLTVLGMELQFAAADQKDLWRQTALFQALPSVCPIDDSPTRFNYRYIDENDYFEIVNSGPLPLKYLLGQYKKGGDLFSKNRWVIWDAEREEEITLWENGRLTPAGERYRSEHQRRCAKPVTATGTPVEPPASHRQAVATAFAPAAPDASAESPALAQPGSTGAPAEANPFTDPNAGAQADERQAYILAIHKVATGIYGKSRVNAELLKIAGEIVCKSVAGLLELSYEELGRLDAIIKLEQTGLKRHPNKAAAWYKELAGLVPANKTIYQLDKYAIDAIHAGLSMPA